MEEIRDEKLISLIKNIMSRIKEEIKCGGSHHKYKGCFWGIILVVLGVVFFLKNFIDISLPDINWSYIWPLILMAIGIRAMLRRR